MIEVTLFESGLEVGTIDMPVTALVLGGEFDGMKITSITLNPPTGEDAIITIEYVF
jgi:hypothetical protein